MGPTQPQKASFLSLKRGFLRLRWEMTALVRRAGQPQNPYSKALLTSSFREGMIGLVCLFSVSFITALVHSPVSVTTLGSYSCCAGYKF